MKRIQIYLLIAISVVMVSCSSTKHLKVAEQENKRLDSAYKQLQLLSERQADTIDRYKDYNNQLERRLDDQKNYNDLMVNQLKELSVISNSQAESIKKSLENISSKDSYIRQLQSAIASKDSLTMNLVLNLKGAIGNLDDKDINVKIDKGVIYIDISDKLLFETGRYKITERAREVLGKVAKVLLKQPDIEFMVEGHTDAVPYHQGVLLDNWDLSVKRATAVVRVLQDEYGIPPARITAAGRGEYVPVAPNDTEYGRSLNRRTRIVILPQLDQFFKLLERPE
ncbi:OmpA/MotB family protein [Pedobacter sp.]|uniref:OmpA/MotB family protein n=1 Tax=Pedobacter sp. TaxID=1411316 RepID=UPI003D7F6AE3